MIDPPSPILETKNLSVRYGKKIAFQNAFLKLKENSVSAIIGPSGCGKSSLLLAMNRLIELVPGGRVEGNILLQGRSIYEKGVNLRVLRQKIGMIFQKPNPFPISIWNNLALPLKEVGVKDGMELKDRIEDVLKQVGLWKEVADRLRQPALNLSGGQQQRLCMARTLTVNPALLLMDEPCSALDPNACGIIEELILRLKKDVTILIVTHNLGQAKRIADEVAFFWPQDDAGRLIESGPCAKLFSDPKHHLTKDYLAGVTG